MSSVEKKARTTTLTKEEWKTFQKLYSEGYYSGEGSNYKDYLDEKRQVAMHVVKMKVFMEAINLEVRARDRILCLGCGRGYEVKALLEIGFKDVIGCDISEWAVKNAVAPVFQHDLLEPFEFSDETFRIIVAFDILEHLATNFVPGVMKEISRLLQKGGWVFMFQPFILGETDKDKGHLTLQPKSWWVEQAKPFNLAPYLVINNPVCLILRKIGE